MRKLKLVFLGEKNHTILYVLHCSLQRGHLETDESESVMGLCRVAASSQNREDSCTLRLEQLS